VKRELDILKKLSHKHVVTLLGSYTQNNQHNILGLLLHPVAVCDLRVLLDELDENQKLAWVDCSEDFKKLMDRLGFQDDIRKMRERLAKVYGCLANAIMISGIRTSSHGIFFWTRTTVSILRILGLVGILRMPLAASRMATREGLISIVHLRLRSTNHEVERQIYTPLAAYS
jgi:hypothetical protein